MLPHLRTFLRLSLLILLAVIATGATHAQLPSPTPVASTPQEHFFTAMASAPQRETKPAGGMGGTPFKEIFPEGGILVGFDVWQGAYGNAQVVCGLTPIYQTLSGRHRGKLSGNKTASMVTIEARDGYAVAGMRVTTEGVIDALQLQFQQIDYAALNLTVMGPYKSDSVGGKGRGNHISPVSSNSKPVIGIFGSGAMCIDRIGLVYADRK